MANRAEVRMATAEDAPAMVEVIHAAFGARPPLDPPSTADNETAESVVAAMVACGAVLAEVDGRVAGVVLLAESAPQVIGMRRVSVHPDFQRHGIGTALVAAAEEFAAGTGHRSIELGARPELPELISYWQRRGYRIVDDGADPLITLGRALPAAVWADSAEAMRALGAALAAMLQPGDLIVASGQLGAGKTTFTQGIGAGLGAQGQIISPTFVLSRVHPTPAGRPDLVHVDAYRLSGLDELEDLDLDASLAEAVTVVEWGRGVAEGMLDHRLEVDILRSDDSDESRLVLLQGFGSRWDGVDLWSLVDAIGGVSEVEGAV
ncbi:tRNA (adenosine(37)-N6)-threonylcarbamoyltransferase complex ATPase subunit type 1 TsaE [Propionibacteriaceae bacterium Y1700]|uniref:tRNA (adenosine(37)-N6)-threonylcarbamoyltransferase complex ATPase subunit type 1 TsaE n=1 Tax=Microlunatus sp. Y1700 TaxID=3418487 RepID=UPI003DA73D7A